MEAGTKAEAIKEHCLLVRTPWGAQPAVLHHPEPQAPSGTAHSVGWAPL